MTNKILNIGGKKKKKTCDKLRFLKNVTFIFQVTKDYLGMALRNNVLYFVYKLNGNFKEIESEDITRSREDQMFFDKVDMQRLSHRMLPSHYLKTNKKILRSNSENLLRVRSLFCCFFFFFKKR